MDKYIESLKKAGLSDKQIEPLLKKLTKPNIEEPIIEKQITIDEVIKKPVVKKTTKKKKK